MRIKLIDEVQYCCKKMRKYYEKNYADMEFRTKDKVPYFFYKLTHKGKVMEKCPFCGAHIDVQVSKSRWGGE